MTPEKLEELVLTVDPAEFVKAVAHLDEKQRAALSTTAQNLRNQIYKNKAKKGASDTLKTFLSKRKDDAWRYVNHKEHYCACLALYACAPVSVLMKSRELDLSGYENSAQVLADRKPEWLSEYCEFYIDRVYGPSFFQAIRMWVNQGLMDSPDYDAYFTVYATAMWHYCFEVVGEEGEVEPLVETLRNDPGLLKDVYSLFRVTSDAFNDHSWIETRHEKDSEWEGWPKALYVLAGEGVLDRDKLLDVSLEGMASDLKQLQLSGYGKFHKALEPTDAEIEARQEKYCNLLSHNVGPVAKFGLEMLSHLEKKKKLDAAAFLDEISLIFQQTAKGTVTTALKLIEKVCKKDAALLPQGIACVIDGLQHPNVDVQKWAVAYLRENESALSADHRARIAEASEYGAASVKADIAALGGASASAVSSSVGSQEDVRAAAEKLDPNASKIWGIDQLLAAQPFKYVPISENILDLRVLHTLEPVEPIKSVDDLFSAIAQGLEGVDNPDDLERILDGISRLVPTRDKDFEARVQPLLHRIGENRYRLPFETLALTNPLWELVWSWFSGEEAPHMSWFSHQSEEIFTPMFEHIDALKGHVLKGQTAQRLCTPTHQNGWIDPLIWIERLKAADADKVETYDLCYSLLRLTPDNRQEAAGLTKGIPSPLKHVAEFVLGKTDKIENSFDASVWVCAARSRDPHADWRKTLSHLEVNERWPDAVLPARYLWRPHTHKDVYDNEEPRLGFACVDSTYDGSQEDLPKDRNLSQFLLDCDVPEDVACLSFPTVVLSMSFPRSHRHYHSDQTCFDMRTMEAYWFASLWPLNTQPLLSVAARKIISRLELKSSIESPLHGFFHALFQKNRPWGELGHLTLALGMACKDGDAIAFTADALIEGIETGQYDPEQLVNTLGKLSEAGWLKINRPVDVLTQVMPVSQLHTWAVFHTLEAWLTHLDLKQRNIGKVLELMLETQAMIGLTLNDALKQSLAELSGSSKAAKIAKKLLNFQGSDEASVIEAVRIAAIDKRMASIPK